MRPVTLIVIHCSASPNGDALFRGSPGTPGFLNPAQVIDGWHVQRGFARSPEARARQNPDLAAIGYHFVVTTTGAIFAGRHLDEPGAHARGHNRDSVGVCLVGTDRYARRQWTLLADLIGALRKRYPAARVVGHRDLSPDIDGDGVVEPSEWLKTCPGFDVSSWLAGGMAPLAEHLIEEATNA